MSELLPPRNGISIRPAWPGDEWAMADTQAHSFVFGYEDPRLLISSKITGYFVYHSDLPRRKKGLWGEVVRGELPDEVLDSETLVARNLKGGIVGIGHAVVKQGVELERHIELEALYLRPEAWGKRAGSRMHDLLLGRLARRNTDITIAQAFVAPCGNGWDFYNRPAQGSTEPAWRDIREVPAAESGSGFFGAYFGVPPVHLVLRDLRRHPIPEEEFI